SKPDLGLKFDPKKLASFERHEPASLTERRELAERLAREAEDSALARARVAELAKTVEQLEAERAALIAEVAAAKRAAAAIPIESYDWSELETRLFKIDALLAEAGWKLTEVRDREFEVHGMPSGSGVGYVDYVLWG